MDDVVRYAFECEVETADGLTATASISTSINPAHFRLGTNEDGLPTVFFGHPDVLDEMIRFLGNLLDEANASKGVASELAARLGAA
jgi:hypothetical protein